MKDVAKTNFDKQNRKFEKSNSDQVRKKRRRKKNMSLYYFTTFIFILAAAVVLSFTVFFRVDKINITGDTDYTREDIINSCHIKSGTSLMSLNTVKAESGINSSLVNVEKVNITKKFPSVVNIQIEQAVPQYCLQVGEEYIVVSTKGKILKDKLSEPDKEYTLVKGLNITESKLGGYYECSDDVASSTFDQMCKILVNNSFVKVTSLDIRDKFDIQLVYDNRVNVDLGGIVNMDYKVGLVKKVIQENEKKNSKFCADVTVRGDNSASVVFKDS